MSVFSVPVTIGVDEDRIAKEIENDVKNQVINKIYENITNVICGKNSWGEIKKGDYTPIREMVKKEVENVVRGKENIIIEMASKELAEKMYKSKACKEAMKSVIEETTK